jgi:hypothetical protein
VAEQPSTYTISVDVYAKNPPEATDGIDSFQLIGKDGKYDKKLTKDEAVNDEDDHLLLRFTGVRQNTTYTLYQLHDGKVKGIVFQDLAFEELESPSPGGGGDGPEKLLDKNYEPDEMEEEMEEEIKKKPDNEDWDPETNSEAGK